MTYERANEMTDAFGKASTEVQGQFWEFVTGMVGATSMFEIDAIEWDKPPYAVDPTDRSRRDGHLKQIGHSYSPAVLRVEVQLSVVGGEALFNPASLTQPLAYGAYGADATLLTVDALKVIAESFSTITTTTVRTTLNVAEGAEIAGLVIDNVTVSGIEALRLEKASLEKLLADLRGRLATAGAEIQAAQAAKDLGGSWEAQAGAAGLVMAHAGGSSEESARAATADEVCKKTGGKLIHPSNDPDIIAGQGTVGLELVEQGFEAWPSRFGPENGGLDCIVVPIGGGSIVVPIGS